MNKLGAPETSQPLQILLVLEAAADQPREPQSHESRAGAYLYLLQHHRNKMRSVADQLLISLSYCYYRFNEALEMARNQCDFPDTRSEEHTSELQSLMRISYAVFCLKKKKNYHIDSTHNSQTIYGSCVTTDMTRHRLK